MPRVILVVAGLVASTGCPRAFDFGPDAYTDPREVLAVARHKQAVPERLTGEAKLRVDRDQGSFAADHFVVVERPDSLRLTTLSFFGNPLALLVLHDGQMLLWDMESALLHHGAATAESLGMVVPVGLAPTAVVNVLLGTPPFLETPDAHLELDYERRMYRVRLSSGVDVQRIWIDPHSDMVREITWHQGERLVGRLTYDDWEPHGEHGMFPGALEYEENGGGKVRVVWHDVELDPTDFPEGIFEVEVPPSVRRVPFTPGDAHPPILPPAPPPAADPVP